MNNDIDLSRDVDEQGDIRDNDTWYTLFEDTPQKDDDKHTSFARERDVNTPGGGHDLRNYWVHGEGAAKIGWGTDGSFARCVANLGKYVKDPQGLCAEYHKAATGEWPAEKGVESVSDVVVADGKKTPEAPYGTDTRYADPGYQEDGTKRYPLDTEEHIRAAWSYINMPKNAAKYDDGDLKKVKARIRRAMRGIGADVADTDASTETIVAHTVAAVDGECPPDHHMMPDGECMPDAEMPKKGARTKKSTTSYALETDEPAGAGDVNPAPTTAPWRGILTVEGIESGDGRMFAANGLTWDEPPLPLMWQKETSHGGEGDTSVRVGSIHKIWREADQQGRDGIFAIRGEGTIDLNNVDGLEAYRRMLEGDMRGNSVDVDSVKGSDVELVFPESTAGPIAAEGEDESINIVDVFAQPELTVFKKGRIRASTMVEIPAFTEARLELTDEVMTASAVDQAILELASDPEAHVNAQLDAITAATSVIKISDTPPREWFQEPADVTATGALTITAEGRVYGYIAPAGVRHRSFGHKSVYVPLKNVDYSRFMGGETITADGGRVATGAITMGCGHATVDYPLSAPQAKDHYDNTCSLVATACVGENKHGVWIAGALLPDVTPHQVRRMMACRLSGDWRPHLDKPNWRELTAALLVPVPGFPMARSAPSVQVEEGQLVAASVPVQFESGPSPRERAIALARAVHLRQLKARVASVVQ